MPEEYCKCVFPKKDPAYSICMKCKSQLRETKKKVAVDIIPTAECDLKQEIEMFLNNGFTLAGMSYTGAYLTLPAGTFREVILVFQYKTH